MGKKNKKGKSGVAEAETGMPRHLRREILTIANELLERCSIPFGSRSSEWNDFLDVYQIVEKLRKKQQNYVLHRGGREEHLDRFLAWLQENGVDSSAVTVVNYGVTGYGLQAKRDIKANELFMAVPRKLMMTTQTAKNSILGPLIKEDRILESMPNVAMALYLLCEISQPDSFWLPYIQFLPTSYNTTLYFNPEEIQLLKASPMLSDILNQFRNITRQYAYFFRLFQGHPEASKLPIKNFCFDDYRWAVCTVMTRQNQIPSASGDEKETALIPLWDLCNHTNGQITTDFNRDLDRSECLSLKDFQKNEEVLIFYGPRSNAEFLLHSGFLYEENEFDRLALRVGVSKKDMLYSMKAEVLARISLNSNCTFYLYVDPVNVIDSDLLAFLRVISMDQDMLQVYLFGEGLAERQQQLKDFSKPVSRINELKAWSFLETRAVILLKAYPTTIEEDSQLLSQQGLSENSQLAIKLRRCEKRILQNVIKYCSMQKKMFEECTSENENQVQALAKAEVEAKTPTSEDKENHCEQVTENSSEDILGDNTSSSCGVEKEGKCKGNEKPSVTRESNTVEGDTKEGAEITVGSQNTDD